jgi:peptidyl-prolyl cis-trans isomerase SurA
LNCCFSVAVARGLAGRYNGAPMNRFPRALALLLAAFGVLALSRPSSATVVERIVAIVGERAILLSDLRERALPFLTQIHQQVPQGAQRNAAISQLYKGLLQKMVDEEIEQRAAVQAKVTVTPREVEEALARVAAQNGVSVDKLLAEARRSGLDDTAYRDELRRQLLQTKLINVRLQGRIRVTEDDLMKAYRTIELEEREKLAFRAAWLVVSVPQGLSPAQAREKRVLAERLARDAERADFAAIVQVHSDDPSTRNSGGVLPYTKVAEVPPVLKRAIVALAPGHVSGAVPIPGGYAIIKLLERDESSLPGYEEARDELGQRVYLEKMTQARRTWLDSLRRQQHVEVRL